MSRLPTLDKLGATVPADLDPNQVASEWFHSFAAHVKSRNVEEISHLFVQDALWRDLLALTWDFRCFDGIVKIQTFLSTCLPSSGFESLKLGSFIRLQKPFPDLTWIIAMFNFETKAGIGTGVFRLVPTSTGIWKAHTMFTNLDDLKGFPEKIGSLRSREIKPGVQWEEERRREVEFVGVNPTVLIVGGGQSGLELAARLKSLEVSTLIIESEPRIGDKWRNRYDALCLHWPVWYDHMPYIPFPPTWPVYTPALKMADWLESYAHSLELNVWTSSTVLNASQEVSGKWNVTVRQHNARSGDYRERVFQVNHLVFATGLGDKFPRMPKIPGMDSFKGELFHSSKYKRASDHKGKTVIVVGAGNSGHDIAADLANHGVDVTMYQRSSTFVMNIDRGWKFLGGALYSEGAPPTEIADRLSASMPHLLQENGMAQRATKAIEADYKETLDALAKTGFKLNHGLKDAGILLLLKQKGGGHYFDIGATQLVIDGKIKIKNSTQIDHFTKDGIRFEDGSELPADVIVLATGLGDMRDSIREVCGDQVADRCRTLWGVNEEGEMNWYRELGVPGLWYMMGSLQLCRFHSKHLALQIKAKEENIFGPCYGIQT